MAIETDNQAENIIIADKEDEPWVHQGYNFPKNCIKCKLTGIEFFLDTGASMSFVPLTLKTKYSYKLHHDTNFPSIKVAEGRAIPVRGYVLLQIYLGRGPHVWRFYVTSVTFPILGRNYFVKFDMLV